MFGAGSEQKLGHDGEAGFIIYIEYGKYNPKKASFPTCNRMLFILLWGHLRRKSEEETRGTEEEGW
jgi:hypothetical protein